VLAFGHLFHSSGKCPTYILSFFKSENKFLLMFLHNCTGSVQSLKRKFVSVFGAASELMATTTAGGGGGTLRMRFRDGCSLLFILRKSCDQLAVLLPVLHSVFHARPLTLKHVSNFLSDTVVNNMSIHNAVFGFECNCSMHC
jgi:hypothetical protein